MKYQWDPWCWSPELGFHRASQPGMPVQLRAATATGIRWVGPTFIDIYLALRLGYGLGTGDSRTGGIPEFVHRFCEISDYISFADASVFARFGLAARGYRQLVEAGDRDRLAEVHRAVFRHAYRLMNLPEALLGDWAPLLEAAATGQPVPDEQIEWANQRCNDSYPRWAVRHKRGQILGTGMLDCAAKRTFDGMRNGNHGGESRGLVRLFALTQPDEKRATRWLDDIGDAVRRHLPDHWRVLSAAAEPAIIDM